MWDIVGRRRFLFSKCNRRRGKVSFPVHLTVSDCCDVPHQAPANTALEKKSNIEKRLGKMGFAAQHRAPLIRSAVQRKSLAFAFKDTRGSLLGLEASKNNLQCTGLAAAPVTLAASLALPCSVLPTETYEPLCTERLAETGVPSNPKTWARRPVAEALLSHAVTPWGRTVLRALAFIGFICIAVRAESDFTSLSGSVNFDSPTLANLGNEDNLAFHGNRLTAIYPSLLESSGQDSGLSENETSAESSGNKKATRGSKLKAKLSKFKLGASRSKSSSQVPLVPFGEQERPEEHSDTDAAELQETTAGEKPRKRSPLGALRRLARKQKTPENHSDTDDGDLQETTAGEKSRKRSPLGALRRLKKTPKSRERVALGAIFDLNLDTIVSSIGDKVTGILQESLSARKEIVEGIEVATTSGVSCLKAFFDTHETRVGFFPHQFQGIRQGLLIYGASSALLQELLAASASNNPNALLEGTSSTVKPGNTVKVLDKNRQLGERAFKVLAVDHTTVTLEGMEQGVGLSDIISTANPVEVGFVDTALRNGWKVIGHENPDLHTRFLEYAEQNGYAEGLRTARSTGNPTDLFNALLDNSDVFRIVYGVRKMLGAPLPLPPTGKRVAKSRKDVSLTYGIFSAQDAVEMLEILQTVLRHHTFPGCLTLNSANLMVQGSLLMVHLLEKHTAGSPLAAPAGQSFSDNPVARVYVNSQASPMREIANSKELEVQCLAGTFSELGINAAAVEGLSCSAHWKHIHRLKESHGYEPLGHKCSLVMRTVCITGDSNKAQSSLLPSGLLDGCNSNCMIKGSLRKGWLNEQAKKQRKRYGLSTKDLRKGDALRMAARLSITELIELDKKVASAWLAAKMLLGASEEDANKPGDATSSDAGRAAEELAPHQMIPEDNELPSLRTVTATVHQPPSDDSSAIALLETGIKRKRGKKRATRSTSGSPADYTVSKPLAPFVTGGNINTNFLNLLSTALVCKALSETDISNPALLSLSLFTSIRGYVSESGAGLENTKQQRKLAKSSDVFRFIYKALVCGLGGELLPPLFTPFASIALQVASFLRVELEESKSFSWKKVVQVGGEDVFNEKEYDKAAKHLQRKANKFITTITPCVAQVDSAADLLMLPEFAKKKRGFLKKFGGLVKQIKKKGRRVTEGMCQTSGELQQLGRMLVVWWTIGLSSSTGENVEKPSGSITVANTFRAARLLFAGYIFNNGHDQAVMGMELIKAGCKTNRFEVPSGWALGAQKGKPSSQPLPFKNVSKMLFTSLKYLMSLLGSRAISDWALPLKVSQQMVDACDQHDVVALADLLSTDAGNLLVGYQCIMLQKDGLKLISQVLGKRSKVVNSGKAYVLFRFLEGINYWRGPKETPSLLTTFEKFAAFSDEAGQQIIINEWNGDFPIVSCAWKQNDRAKEAMLRKGTSYRPAERPAVTGDLLDFHCPAAAPLRVSDLAKASLPETTEFCASTSAQCMASEYSKENAIRL